MSKYQRPKSKVNSRTPLPLIGHWSLGIGGPGMFQRLDGRAAHWLLLAAGWAVGCLPNLGGPSLWDIDEGNNAEAAREMLDSGNWVIPTFNYRLRDDKPALLYWLQLAG